VGNYRKCLYELANGEWVLMLDGDDYLNDPSYVSKAIKAASLQSDIDLVFANAARLRDDLNGQIQSAHENHDLPEIIEGCELFLLLASKKISLFHNTCLYKRHKAIDMDFYRRNIISSDWESLHRYILTGKVAYLDEVAAVWRIHGRNASKGISAQERIENLQAIIGPYQQAKTSQRFPLPVIESWFEKRLSQTADKDGRTLLKTRDFPGYRNYLRYLKSVHPVVYTGALDYPPPARQDASGPFKHENALTASIIHPKGCRTAKGRYLLLVQTLPRSILAISFPNGPDHIYKQRSVNGSA
jgi:hypothetical protein